MPPLRSAVLTMTLLGVAGCGGGAGDGGGSASHRPADLAHAAPRDVLARVRADVRRVRSYRVTGMVIEPGGRKAMAIDVDGRGGARMRVTIGTQRAQVVLVGRKEYIKGNAEYWRRQAGVHPRALARRLAGQWITVPSSSAHKARAALRDVSLKHLVTCFGGHRGTTHNKGMQSVQGRRVLVIQDLGDQPGSQPTTWYLDTGGGHVRPARIQAGGAPGAEACGAGIPTEMAFARYDRIARITAPRGARTPQEAVSGGGGTTGTPL